MSSDEQVFRIGCADSDRFEMVVLRRQFPNADDFWDGNSLRARITVRAGALGGSFDASIRSTDLDDHRDSLARLYATLDRTEKLDTLEHHYEIEIRGDGRGHFCASARVREDSGPELAALTFVLDFDQTELPAMIAQLDALRAAYPVRGAPQRSP